MIDEIQVENLALIRKCSLEPACGLTVLTGETGAGKTALLSALKLLMGERADKDVLRDGQEQLRVSGRFIYTAREEVASKDPQSPEVPEVFRDPHDPRNPEAPEASQTSQDPQSLEEEFVVTRTLSREGRSRVNIDGTMVSVSELAKRTSPLIDLCGQHEHQRLMKAATHVEFLDAWAADSINPARKAYIEAFDKVLVAQEELERVRAASEASSAKLEDARFALARIDEVNPQEGEYEELIASLARAENAEALVSAVNGAYEALSGEAGATDALNSAASLLEGAASYDEKLGSWAGSLREASYVLEDVSADARAYRDELEFSPDDLVLKQQRMAALQGLLRNFGPRIEDVFERRKQAAELVSLIDDATEREDKAMRALNAAEEELKQLAEALGRARMKAAPAFERAVTSEMARLEMATASLVCAVEPLDRSLWTRAGAHAVEFLFCPGKNMQARPLARIASGGEISRVMLALKVVLGAHDSVDTLVFDEVDAGVGGSAALALAEVLATLAKTHQVIVVTHLAQVAVRGNCHYLVSKTQGDKGVPETSLRLLKEDERPEEIARMLSGKVNETSLTHARELLKAAKE